MANPAHHSRLPMERKISLLGQRVSPMRASSWSSSRSTSCFGSLSFITASSAIPAGPLADLPRRDAWTSLSWVIATTSRSGTMSSTQSITPVTRPNSLSPLPILNEPSAASCTRRLMCSWTVWLPVLSINSPWSCPQCAPVHGKRQPFMPMHCHDLAPEHRAVAEAQGRAGLSTRGRRTTWHHSLTDACPQIDRWTRVQFGQMETRKCSYALGQTFVHSRACPADERRTVGARQEAPRKEAQSL